MSGTGAGSVSASTATWTGPRSLSCARTPTGPLPQPGWQPASTARPCRPRERRRPSQPLVGEELAHGCGDLGRVRFEREVACVQQLDIGAGDVTFEGFGSGGQEERVVAAPDGQQRWLMGAEVVLEPRVEVDVAGVVEEEVELDFVRARPGQVVIVEGVAVGRDQRRVGYSVGVLPHGCFGLEHAADG